MPTPLTNNPMIVLSEDGAWTGYVRRKIHVPKLSCAHDFGVSDRNFRP